MTATPGKATTATIDRIEDDVVVLVTGDGKEHHLPRAKLPKTAREGDVVDLRTLQIDEAATRALKDEVAAARARAKKNTAPPGDL